MRDVGIRALASLPCLLAFLTRTNFPQKLTRVNAEIVIVVPRKLDGVLAHALRRKRLRMRLEHQQGTRSRGRGIPWPPSGFAPFIFTHGARTGIPKIGKSVMRNMPIPPLDIDSSPCSEMHLDGLGVSRSRRRLEWGLHLISIA